MRDVVRGRLAQFDLQLVQLLEKVTAADAEFQQSKQLYNKALLDLKNFGKNMEEPLRVWRYKWIWMSSKQLLSSAYCIRFALSADALWSTDPRSERDAHRAQPLREATERARSPKRGSSRGAQRWRARAARSQGSSRRRQPQVQGGTPRQTHQRRACRRLTAGAGWALIVFRTATT